MLDISLGLTLCVCTVCVCVSGVTVLKGQEEIEVHAPVVISNAGIFNTFQKFLPQHIQDKPGNTVCGLIL